MELPQPEPAADEVLIQVAYAGVNPVDWKVREGYLKERMPSRFPLILGWDVAGRIVTVGSNVSPQRVGELVFAYARKPVAQWGTYAEFVACEAAHVVPAPKSLSLRDAAAIPIATLTAWQSIVEWGHVGEGQRVLIHAGAGGVGGMAIQLAHHFGAHVTTTASERHHAYVKQLGADVAIDYTKAKVTETFDLVFDTVGGKVFEAAWEQVRSGGKLVSILEQPDPQRAKSQGIYAQYVNVHPDGGQLLQIAQLLDSGALKAPEVREFPLEQAVEALEIQRQGHTQGKLVIKVS